MVEESNTVICKYCGEDGVVKYGSYKGVQRYWCKICQRKSTVAANIAAELTCYISKFN